MGYTSINTLQEVLKEQVFCHTKDAKKAAGRALGTMVELVTYYLLREWGMGDCVSIERKLPEYGNMDITHNVEFLLHPVICKNTMNVDFIPPLSVVRLKKELSGNGFDDASLKKTNAVVDKNMVLRNACLLAECSDRIAIANCREIDGKKVSFEVSCLYKSPFAMVECKRVGVEEGCKKGPQTIEKAKQGAYVARMTSSLQKVRDEKGVLNGLVYMNGMPVIMPYDDLMNRIISSNDLLKDFIMSIGVVSNHGNWFTSENQNKELKVLAQSYDWLIFLTDDGLSQFITELLLNPKPCYASVKKAFEDSYKEGKKMNVFTKSKIRWDAHCAISSYFSDNINRIEHDWFNIISPEKKSLTHLKDILNVLRNKDWKVFL